MSKPYISVIFTAYMRPDLLRDTVESFLKVTQYPRDRMELILTDDGSPPELQDKMLEIPFDKYVLSAANEGLARPANRALHVARGDFVLQSQDDWHCEGPPDYLEAGMELLNEFPDVGMIRYRFPRADRGYPADRCQTSSGRPFLKFRNVNPDSGTTSGDFPYTHNPHLKRRDFHDVVGWYPEDIPMRKMELAYCRMVAAQHKYRMAYLEGYDVFRHTGEGCSVNPVKRRERMKEALLTNPLTRVPFRIYLTLKHGRKQ